MGIKKKTRAEKKSKPVLSDADGTSQTKNQQNPHFIVGHINCNLVGTYYGPMLEQMAEDGSEKYAEDLLEYTEQLKLVKEQSNSNETDSSIPLKSPVSSLFATKMNLDEFKIMLDETTQHFTSSAKKKKGSSSSSSSSSSGDGSSNNWKVHANAAKFERLLDEKYGPFRPLMDRMPQLEQFVRNTQRKMAKGHFSPFRQTRPLPLHTSFVLLFMLHRNGVKWEATTLAAIFFLTGLHPWALVVLVAAGRFYLNKRKNKRIGDMPSKVKLVEPYYSSSLYQGHKTVADQHKQKKNKHEILLQPVGTPLPDSLFLAENNNNNNNNDSNDDSHDFDTLVIGSGATALYTAALLSRAGRQVLVLSSDDDASECRTLLTAPEELKSIPFDVQSNNIAYVDRMQRLLAPALCTKTDFQGGVRFATVGSEKDFYAHDILSIPGMGVDGTSNNSESIPFVVHAGSQLHLANDAAMFLGDGWPQSEEDITNSTSASYLSVCASLAVDSSQFYTSKLFPESVNNMRSKNGYAEAGQRNTSAFLDKCLPLNAHVRSLMAGLGMRGECLPPSRTSMAAHITNILAVTSPQGQAYPVGGPRSLCHAMASVIEQNGGKVYTGVNVSELLFRKDGESTTDKKSQKKKSTTEEKSDDNSNDAPRCIGVKLADGRSIFVSSDSTNDDDHDDDGAVICTDGFLPTFIQRLPDSLRMKFGVPKGLPALHERRPLIKVLVALDGSSDDLNVTGADWYRLPNASLAYDEIDSNTREIKCGIIGAETLQQDEYDYITSNNEKQNLESPKPSNDDIDAVNVEEKSGQQQSNKKPTNKRNYFTNGSSWMKVSFPSAKDPSWKERFGDISTCVVTIEADNDTCREFSTKPRIFSILSNKDAKRRLLDRVTNDLIDNFPQLEGKMKYMELHGPFRAGLSHTPERFAAKGVRPHTPYPGLYMGGPDITIGDSFSGSIVAGWLAANAVMGYSFFDQMFLEKDIISDLVKFMEKPSKRKTTLEEDVLAVPFVESQGDEKSDKLSDTETTAINQTAESSKEE